VTLRSNAQREGDLPLLERYFVKRFAEQFGKPVRGITRRAQAVLAKHSWPGNVRELEKVLGGASMMTEAEAIDVGDLPEYIHENQIDSDQMGEILVTLEEMERKYALRVLQSTGGNKVRAAELLGISRTKLYRILGDSQSAESGGPPPEDLGQKAN